ncbi:uncharacterized protein PHALS_06329 [Plasmopara halstedii]|uniref:Uncharacterized protein n=1 Tax=Plasmopara halstedii TaxID=4781 RepID=A0A0P1B4A3_PLAHL|nr:uncharacterized protein PHALS_06329 [Plasmopara halstedii]CEG48510.1 hypothetical protein PHALS_06329 [Plasmopara halstedii]|eukprot:XP_024584879.1 hypothetical protein PHALS_06329 [Plasmopara halstedii]
MSSQQQLSHYHKTRREVVCMDSKAGISDGMMWPSSTLLAIGKYLLQDVFTPARSSVETDDCNAQVIRLDPKFFNIKICRDCIVLLSLHYGLMHKPCGAKKVHGSR